MASNASVVLDVLRVQLASPGIQALLGIYLALAALTGFVLLPLVIIALLSSKDILSKSAVINCLTGFIISTIAVLILPFSGHVLDPTPPPDICLAQLAILYGGLFMAAVAAVLIMIQLLLTFPGSNTKGHKGIDSSRASHKLVGLPFASLLLYVTIQTVAATSQREKLVIARSPLVCRFDIGTPFLFRKGPVLMLAIALILIAIYSVYMWLRVRITLRRIGVWPHWGRMMQTEHASWISFLLRMAIFEVVCLAAAIFVLLDTTTDNGGIHIAAEAFAGLSPLCAFFIFGTVKNVRERWFRWCFRVPKDNSTDVEELPQKTTASASISR